MTGIAEREVARGDVAEDVAADASGGEPGAVEELMDEVRVSLAPQGT